MTKQEILKKRSTLSVVDSSSLTKQRTKSIANQQESNLINTINGTSLTQSAAPSTSSHQRTFSLGLFSKETKDQNQKDIKDYVEEIIIQVINEKKSTKEAFLDNLSKSLACKRSIKANEFLSATQISYLLEDLIKCSNPYTCPHGRPIIIKHSKYQVEKWFKRIQ